MLGLPVSEDRQGLNSFLHTFIHSHTHTLDIWETAGFLPEAIMSLGTTM